MIEAKTLHTWKNVKIIFLAVLLTKLYIWMINLAKQLFFTDEKIWPIDLLKEFLKSMIISKSDKKHFNKDLVMFVEDERSFQSSNKCWICNKLFTHEDKKVRHHDHKAGNIETFSIKM